MRRSLLAAALAPLLVLAACGGDGDPSTVERAEVPASSTTDRSTTTAGPTTSTTSPPTTATVPVPAPAEPAGSPEELATRLVDAERVARDPDATPERIAAAAFEAQQLYRQLGRNPGWDARVLAATPADLHLTVTATAAARREFRAMHSTLTDTLPAWRIVEPPPAAELLSYYQEGEARFGVPWSILAAVNLVETGFGRIRGTSVAGAQGPMQFMPATWAAYGMGGDIEDTHDAIMGAANYLAANGGGRGDIDNALWHYNHSDRYVRGVKHLASVMAEDPAAFASFHQWQIVYLSTMGDVWLPTGYERFDRTPVSDYVTANPDHHLGTATG